ncbi:MAG TPA: S9 family peptidase [Terriglobales bacterium]|nr:S9 family peptidase [Terriglobales bacterium]
MRKGMFLSLFLAVGCAWAQAPRRPLSLDDMARLRSVSDPQCSPGGHWVAYTVGTVDTKADSHRSHIWMANYDGTRELQMTTGESSETAPRWSPDGKFLSFLSARPGPAKGRQVWLLDRQGGEARQITAVKGSLKSYAWSPDSQRLALVIEDPAPVAKPGAPPRPIVVDRYKFREDRIGFLPDRQTHIYLFDRASQKLSRLTRGNFNESSPSWSPHGGRIAFISNHDPHPDRELDGQLYVAASGPEGVERALTKPSDYTEDTTPSWSPDGHRLAFLEGVANKWGAYAMTRLAIVDTDGADAPALAAPTWDRGVSTPRFSSDGQSVELLTADDRSAYPIRVNLADHSVTRLEPAPLVVSSLTHAGGCQAGLVGHDNRATEVYALAGATRRQLSHQNDALFQQLKLAKVREVSFASQDGTDVHGLLTTPLGYVAGSKAPLLLRIHGGPNGQDGHSFNYENQMFAADGYAVLQVNYRGSSGRGQAYARAIAADWGHLEVQDLEAGVKHVIQMGIADPNRLGVGGWSYGCILTDYMIASDSRFKAATCGAGTGFTVAFYGVDEYIIQYNDEIGPPWNPKAWATYQKISYPFLHADRIKTPTLFLGGTLDANVPLVGGEEMYQALKTLNVPTELVVYPGEYHGISRPSFQRDRMRRYLAWYAKYLKPR